MYKIILISLLFITGCAAAREATVVATVDVVSPYLERELPTAIQEMVIDEIERTDTQKIIADMKIKMPATLNISNMILDGLEKYFKEREKEAFTEFTLVVNPILKQYNKDIYGFDIDSNGEITFNEYVRLYLFLEDKDLSWKVTGNKYLTWKYLKRVFMSPIIAGITKYTK